VPKGWSVIFRRFGSGHESSCAPSATEKSAVTSRSVEAVDDGCIHVVAGRQDGSSVADPRFGQAREDGALAVEVPGHEGLELAVALGEPLEALGEGAGARVEVAAEDAGEPFGDLAVALDEELAHRVEQALALALDGLGVERADGLAEGEDAEAERVPGVGVALGSLGALGELVGHLGIGDDELEAVGGHLPCRWWAGNQHRRSGN